MRYLRIAGLCCLAAVLAFANANEKPLSPEDVALADQLAMNTAYLRDLKEPRCEALFARCGFDSNRFCRVAQDIYRRYPDVRPRGLALTIIQMCGDSGQVPFLDSCVTNLYMGPAAIQVLNGIEGFTSNSVLRMARFHAVTNEDVYFVDRNAYAERTFILRRMAFAATRPDVPTHLRDFTRNYIYSFASNNCNSVAVADRELMNLDPSFENSKRRLALLRYAQPLAKRPYAAQYLATEIRKLEEYPETSLPD